MSPSNPVTPAAGVRIGRYLLVRRVGRGGAGEVWEAELLGPMGFRKAVAVKLLPAGAADPRRQDELAREAKLGALVSHPNVVTIHELGVDAGHLFIAMELVTGPNVGQLAGRSAMPAGIALEITRQAAAGLGAAHRLELPHGRGLAHRDVKFDNLLVSPAGLVKVADFGIARLAGESVDGWEGTRGYAAPEQRKGGRVDVRADVFALGVVLFRLLTGDRPFPSDDPTSVERYLDGFAARVDPLAAGTGDVVRRCLRVDPDDRFSDGEEVAQALAPLVPRGAADLLADQASGPSVETRSTPRPPAPRGGTAQCIGRNAEEEELRALLDGGNRWITVVGPGGVGKSALAEAVVRPWAARTGSTVFTADFGRVETLDEAVHPLAAMLDIPAIAGLAERRLSQLADAMTVSGPAVLVLDDADRAVARLEAIVAALTHATPSLVVVITARRAAGPPAERVITLGPLPRPAAIALFRATAGPAAARAADGTVGDLVDRLDRVPLAIVLAASRVPGLGVERVLERLEAEPLTLLRSLRRSDSGRHVTMRQTLAWSWGLLGESERRVLEQLSVFRGAFDLDAAAAVVSMPPDAPFLVELLDGLVRGSWLALQETDREARFRLYQMVREYAAERIQGADLTPARDRHASWFARRGEPEQLALAATRDGRSARSQNLRDLDDLLAATDHALDTDAIETAGRVVRVAWTACYKNRPTGPVATRLERLRLRLTGPSTQALITRLALATHCRDQGELERAGELARDALELGRVLGPESEGRALWIAAEVGRGVEPPDLIEAWATRAIELGDATRSREVQVGARGTRALHRLYRGELDLALQDQLETLAMCRQYRMETHEARALSNLALLYAERGDMANAEVYYAQAAADAKAARSRFSHATALLSLASVVMELGRLEEGLDLNAHAIEALLRAGRPDGTALAWINAGEASRLRDDPVVACAYFDRGIEMAARFHLHRDEAIGRTSRAALRIGQGDLLGARADLDVAAAVTRRLGDPLQVARATAIEADLLAAQGDMGAAVTRILDASGVCEAYAARLLARELRYQSIPLLVGAGRSEEARATWTTLEREPPPPPRSMVHFRREAARRALEVWAGPSGARNGHGEA